MEISNEVVSNFIYDELDNLDYWTIADSPTTYDANTFEASKNKIIICSFPSPEYGIAFKLKNHEIDLGKFELVNRFKYSVANLILSEEKRKDMVALLYKREIRNNNIDSLINI